MQKTQIAPENDLSMCIATLFRFRSEFSYRNYDEHIYIDLRTLSSMIANNIFQQHLVFLSSLCVDVDKDLTINIH